MFSLKFRTKDLKWTLCFVCILMCRLKGQEDYQTPRHFVLNLTQTSWIDARDLCMEGGGSLAAIYDYSTIPDLGLSDFLLETDEALVWIGLHKADNNSWIWDNNQTITYTNWQAGDSDLNGDCVAATFRHPYTWTSRSCTLRLPFLCTFDGGECRFEVYQNASIAANNYMYLYDKSVAECQDVCLTNTVFICQSFEYDADGKRCQFNNGNMWTLSNYYSTHQGWIYYHRTCNSGEVTGELLDLSPPSKTSSIITLISTTTQIVSPTSTFIPETTSSIEIECSEMFVTKNIYVTHDVYQTSVLTFTKDVYVSRDVPITREIHVTNDVIISTTVTETSVVTVTETSTMTLTPSPAVYFPSESIYTDPVEELMELETEIKEKAKNLKKVSIMDDRPSATYVGYIAILFLSCVFGAILVFDLLTLCQSGLCMKCMTKCKNTKTYTPRTSFKKRNNVGGTDNSTFCSDKFDNEHILEKDKLGNQSPFSETRLWRKSLWTVGDSGFGGSSSEATNSESGSCVLNDRENIETVTIEIQDENSTPKTTDFIIAGDIGGENKHEEKNDISDGNNIMVQTENDTSEFQDLCREDLIESWDSTEERITSL